MGAGQRFGVIVAETQAVPLPLQKDAEKKTAKLEEGPQIWAMLAIISLVQSALKELPTPDAVSVLCGEDADENGQFVYIKPSANAWYILVEMSTMVAREVSKVVDAGYHGKSPSFQISVMNKAKGVATLAQPPATGPRARASLRPPPPRAQATRSSTRARAR